MEFYIYITGMQIGIAIILLCIMYAIIELIRWRD